VTLAELSTNPATAPCQGLQLSAVAWWQVFFYLHRAGMGVRSVTELTHQLHGVFPSGEAFGLVHFAASGIEIFRVGALPDGIFLRVPLCYLGTQPILAFSAEGVRRCGCG